MPIPLAASRLLDEFDLLPDEFDFSAVEEPLGLPQPQSGGNDVPDEYDLYNETDSFAGIDLDAIAALGPPARASPVAQPPTNQSLQRDDTQIRGQGSRNPESPSVMSTQYSFDEIDPAFLEEVDAIERVAARTAQAVGTPHAVSTSSPVASQGLPSTQPASAGSAVSRTTASSLLGPQNSNASMAKRKRSILDDGHPPSCKKSKGKSKAKDPHASARAILSDMEESMQCPICCEIFIAPHVGVPCGHSYCGDCCVRWIKQNVGRHPSCPTCRAKLTNNILVVPNYALQHAIEKHVAALGTTGVVDWQPTGIRYQERQRRQGLWSELSTELPGLQGTQWGLLSADSPPTSQLIALVNAQVQAAMEESSSSEEEDEADGPSSPSPSPDLFAFFSTPPTQAWS